MNLEKVKTKQMNNNLKAGLITVLLFGGIILLALSCTWLIMEYSIVLPIIGILMFLWVLFIVFAIVKNKIDES